MKKNRKLLEKTCVTDAETEDGSKPCSDSDQDSDVSFHEDKDEKIGKKEIEEEGWVEYIKRSTKEAGDQMNRTRIPCWIETWKNEVENGIENSNSP